MVMMQISYYAGQYFGRTHIIITYIVIIESTTLLHWPETVKIIPLLSNFIFQCFLFMFSFIFHLCFSI